MIKKYHKGSEGEFQKWEHFRVVKKFTILPLRIRQYTSQTTWWSWLETSYILQSWEIDSSIKSYIFGGYWRNERISDIEEYNDYQNHFIYSIKENTEVFSFCDEFDKK